MREVVVGKKEGCVSALGRNHPKYTQANLMPIGNCMGIRGSAMRQWLRFWLCVVHIMWFELCIYVPLVYACAFQCACMHSSVLSCTVYFVSASNRKLDSNNPCYLPDNEFLRCRWRIFCIGLCVLPFCLSPSFPFSPSPSRSLPLTDTPALQRPAIAIVVIGGKR